MGRPLGSKNRYKYIVSEETRKKISQTLKGRKLSEEHRKNISKSGPEHNSWKGGKFMDSQGYYRVWAPNHPFKDSKGYVFEHRLVMEAYLGRYLERYELVHHINDNRIDNRIENLQLVTKSEHNIIHFKKKN